jgi:hypothetical protein
MTSRAMKTVMGGVAAGVLTVGAVAGVAVTRDSAQAQTPTPTPTRTATATRPNQQEIEARITEHLNRLAQNLGVTPDKLRDALKQTALQEIDAAVQAGRMTQAQADRAREAINNGTAGGFGAGPIFGGFGPGGPGGMRGGPGGAGGPGGMFGGMRAGHLGDDKIATFLGITQDQLRQELRSGKSLAQVATAHGKSADQLKTFIVTSITQQVNDAVRAGTMTQAQADRILNGLSARVDEMINHVPGQGGMRRGR